MTQEADDEPEFSRRWVRAMAVLTVLGVGTWVALAVTIGVPLLTWFFGGLILLGTGGYWWRYVKHRKHTR